MGFADRFEERPPPMPEGIVVHKPDGEEIICEPTYKGLDDEGRWVWDVLTPIDEGYRVTIRKVPPRTQINFPTRIGTLEAHQTETDD